MKKKISVIIVFVAIICLIFNLSTKKEETEKFTKKIIKNSNDIIAVYVENESGGYNKTTYVPDKDDNYVFNSTKSVCDGDSELSWNKEYWGLEISKVSKSKMKCYLYFDQKEGEKIEEINTILGNIEVKKNLPSFMIKAENNMGIYSIEDEMYGGTSYYWRGAVTNNYLKFAGFCWRIIRINGDGTLRLIYDGTTCHNNGESTAESVAIKRQYYNSLPYISTIGYNYGVGWTYNPEGKQRPEAGDTAIDSNVKIKTEKWYNDNIGNNATYDSKVANGKFCNDRNIKTGEDYTDETYYHAGFTRIIETYQPLLSCNSNDIYTLKVGAIMADEAMLAGGRVGSNKSFYLYNGQDYWTMTPSICDRFGAKIFIIDENGSINYSHEIADSLNIRPVINLNSDVILSGNGTLDNPYEVV